MPILKNSGPLLVDKIRGYFDRLPPWLRDVITVRVEKQKVDAKVTDLDQTALSSELKQEVTDEKLRTNTFLGDGVAGSGNDMAELPASHPSEVVLRETGQVADVTETIGATESHLVEGPPLQEGSSEQVGDLWVTKKVEAPTFDRKAFQAQKDDLMPPEFRAAIVQKTEEHTVDGTAAMPTLGATDLARKESQEKVGVKSTLVQSRDLATPPTLVGQKTDRDFNGAVVTMSKDIVAATTHIGPVFGVTQTAVTPYDDRNAVTETWRADGGFPTIQLNNYEQELDTLFFTNVSVVPMGQVYTPGALVMDFEERKIDKNHSLRVENTLGSLPVAYTQWVTQMFPFPALLLSLDFRLVALGTAGRNEPQWTAGIRAAFTAPVLLRVVTSYYTAPPTPITPTLWAPGDVTFKGVSFSVSLSNLLFDTWSNIGVSFSGDTLYGNIVDRFSINSTFPGASTYIGWIGTEQPISSSVTKYKRLWTRKDTYVKIQ